MLFTENLLLACSAGIASVYLAYRVPVFLNHFLPRQPAAIPLEPDWRVFAYLSAATLLTAALSGIAPALQALNLQLSESLKGRQLLFGGPRSGSGLRNFLVGAQVALSLVLLVGAGIFLRAYQQVTTSDPGVETRQVLAVSLRLHGTKPGSWTSFHRILAEHLETVPGVKSVAYAARPPLHPDSILVQLPGQPVVGVQLNTISPGYFATLGIPILQGRAIDVSDSGALHTVAHVVVSERFAKEFWPRENALAKTLRTPTGEVFEVVGVARDTAVVNPGGTDDPTIYKAWKPVAGSFSPVVRLASDNGTAALAVRGAVRQAFPGSGVDVRTVQSLMDERIAPFWNIVTLVVILGGTALLLAIIGTYATVAFAVGQRRKEVAIRIALGAQKSDIFRSVIAFGVRPVAVGLVVGVVMAAASSRVLEQALRGAPFPLHTRDPLPYAAVCLVLAAAAVVAMLGPARRGSVCDPVQFLREE
jgi:predicted permease